MYENYGKEQQNKTYHRPLSRKTEKVKMCTEYDTMN